MNNVEIFSNVAQLSYYANYRIDNLLGFTRLMRVITGHSVHFLQLFKEKSFTLK